MPLLNVDNLKTHFHTRDGIVKAVDGVSFSVERGETLGIVGESGSGKSVTCYSLMGLVRCPPGHIDGEDAGFDGVQLLNCPSQVIREIRGNRISMIFQDPLTSLNPYLSIGSQLSEPLVVHGIMSRREARAKAIESLIEVGIQDAERCIGQYPHQFSGGMRQRAMIAMAMVAKPDLLIADEPTTALDVTTQAQVLGLMKDLQQETGMAMILVTHDLGVVANMAEKVVVMHKGRVMEAGPAEPILRAPAHPYTQKLFNAAPKIPEGTPAARPAQEDLILELKNVTKTFTLRSGKSWSQPTLVRACEQVDLALPRGKTLAIVGESGSGKTTAARIALGAESVDAGGEILFRAAPGAQPIKVHEMDREARRAFQRQAQMVFQDPYSSLSPRMRIFDTLSEPLEIHQVCDRATQKDKAAEMLRLVGLPTDMLSRYPHAFSGGQRQRLSIARALMLDPALLVCDEPTSALDVSVQEQILSLLEEIRDARQLSYLFISHDLAVVARIADEVAVMRRGLIVEQAAPEVLFHNPKHPYTKALIAAQPVPDVDRPINLKLVAQGAGAPESWPEAFRFDGFDAPPLVPLDAGHKVRCHV